MTTFHEDIQRWSEEDPKFAYELALAAAEDSLGQQAARMREGLHLTQAELGKLMGVRQPSVARFEGAGRTPTVETLWKFATALNCEFVIGPHFAVRVQTSGQSATSAPAAHGAFRLPAVNNGDLARELLDRLSHAGSSPTSTVIPSPMPRSSRSLDRKSTRKKSSIERG